jgi:hypothetical protein
LTVYHLRAYRPDPTSNILCLRRTTPGQVRLSSLSNSTARYASSRTRGPRQTQNMGPTRRCRFLHWPCTRPSSCVSNIHHGHAARTHLRYTRLFP